MNYPFLYWLLLCFVFISCEHKTKKNNSDIQESERSKYVFSEERFEKIYNRDIARLTSKTETKYQKLNNQQLIDSLRSCLPSEAQMRLKPDPELACQLLLLALKRKIPVAYYLKGSNPFIFSQPEWETSCICNVPEERLLYSDKAYQMGEKQALWTFVHYYEETRKDSLHAKYYLEKLSATDGFASYKLYEYFKQGNFQKEMMRDSAVFYFEKSAILGYPWALLAKAKELEKREGKITKSFDLYIKAYEKLKENIGYASEYMPLEHKLKSEYSKEWAVYYQAKQNR